MLLVAVVLDPRFKLEFLEFCMEGMYDESNIKLTKEKVRATLQRIYDWHAGNSRSLTIGMEADDVLVCANARMDLATSWRRHKKYVPLESMSEVDRYLTSPIEGISEDKNTFDILGWWKINATRYPILSLVAKDVLAIPVTSVASESAFSTGGCVLNPFRTSLLPNTVEALVCTHNWLRLTAKPIDLLASMKEIKQYDALDAELFKVAVSEAGHKS
ncbi:Zinc finger bed domain-containing protein daysleeper [Thalictrum thalictroides]|uniref:Zinc finger bed domain-containing protein daysleeper n=1 Tax=Thalictrum thalictroides TaxID=46969 RepID=A0A7J6URY4_THATH|nr:Zinc finger bed domain-containing protein daysleeper [Thalictrum thalictroides]